MATTDGARRGETRDPMAKRALRLSTRGRSSAQQSTAKLLWLLLGATLVLSGLVRLHMALQPGLWVDEIFSLGMATGHSLEHPAVVADPALGDYVEPLHGQSAATWTQYLRHDSPPAGPGRIIRAVMLSDTNPPLYYLALSAWTRLAGTSDAALRLFSVLAALLSLPILWRVAQMIGGGPVAIYSCLLFAFAPAAIYYSAEGRMYSLCWLLALALAYLSLRLHRDGARPPVLVAWVLVGASALLTHYFLVFVWIACAAWLLLAPGRTSRAATLGGVLLSMAVVMPWYVNIPGMIEQWRVTAGWLDVPLSAREALLAPLSLTWSMVAPLGLAQGWYPPNPRWIIAGAIMLGCLAALRRSAPPLITTRELLPWLWLSATVLGVVALDLLRGTSAALVPRYALMGMPAAFLIVAMLFSRLPPRAAGLLLLVVIAAWAPGIHSMAAQPARPSYPFMQIAAYVDSHASETDVVIVRSIPSGVLGITRYMNSETPVVSWVEQLETRKESDALDRITTGTCQVLVIGIHTFARVNTVEPWLRSNARFIAGANIGDAKVQHFRRDPPVGLPPGQCSHLPAAARSGEVSK